MSVFRRLCCLFGICVLGLVVSCSRKGAAPPPLEKQLLTGKWKSTAEPPFITAYEFAEDGALKVTIRAMDQPIPGRYTWSGERTLDLKYQTTADVQQAYKAAVKAYQDDVADRIKAGKLPDRAGPSILSAVRDEWPASETLRVAISAQPPLLMLSSEAGASQNFEKAE